MKQRSSSKLIPAIVLMLASLITLALFVGASCSSHGGSVAANPPASSSSLASSAHGSLDDSESGSASAESQSESGEAEVASVEILPLAVDADPALYTYEDLVSDVAALSSNYPEWVRVEHLGVTADGRDLPLVIVGNPQADNKVLVHGGIHAREYMTTQLVMKQASAFLEHARAGDAYDGASYAEALDASAIYLVPSANPDGAALSQGGIDGIKRASVRDRILEIASLDGREASAGYFRNWKANANGVDLNRNFDALWSGYGGASHPSSELYKGEAPGCEVESAALIDLTRREGFSRTISYHAQGSLVYWYFGQTGALLDETEQFAREVSAVTGYQIYANYENLDPAGYKDWALQTMAIPSLTIEIGAGETPLPPEQFETIWRQNQFVWETAIRLGA